MIESVIRWSLHNRIFVLLATALIVAGGLLSLNRMPVDAIPDLSDVQVIIKPATQVKHLKSFKIKLPIL